MMVELIAFNPPGLDYRVENLLYLLHEHQLAEPLRVVRIRTIAGRVRPQAEPSVRLDAVPAIQVRRPERSGRGRQLFRQVIEVCPGDRHFEAPALIAIPGLVQRAADVCGELHSTE